MDLLKSTITIAGCEVKQTSTGSTQFKIKSHENKTYTLWQTKSDGSESRAYQEFKLLPNNGVGRNVEIAYKEEPLNIGGKDIIMKTIVMLKEVGGTPFAQTQVKSQMFSDNKAKDEAKWEELGWKKCKYGFLIEAFKKDMKLEDVENISEKWADACQRRTNEISVEAIKDQFENIEVVNNDEIRIEDIPF